MKENEDKPQDVASIGTSPSGENENSTALKTESATNDVTSNKVREILGQPKMTPEDRERKRKELNEKQKEARKRAERTGEASLNEENADTSIVNATNSEQSVQPRENLILSAVKFLSSPKVRNADEDKKLNFLLSKGLTRAEIDIAKSRVDETQSSVPPDVGSQTDSATNAQLPTDSPPVPPRTYQNAMARTPLWKHLILVLLIICVFNAAMIAVIKKFLGPAVTAIIFAKQQLYSHQLNLFKKFNENLSTILSLRKSTPSFSKFISQSDINDVEESPTPYELDGDSTPPTLLAPLATDLSELTEKLSAHRQNMAKYNAMPDLQLSLTSLATYLSSSIYSFSSWSTPNDRDSSVSQVRSEIRSLKGMLINRRNFPKIPSVPSYSAQLPQSSSQPQQVNTLDEDLE